MGNIIKVNLSNACGITQTESVTQWDFGYIMQISGLSVQNDTEIHFANHGDKDAIVDVAKYEDGILTVKIPDILLTKGIDIFVHVYIATDEEGKTIRTARIPVKRRAKPSDYIYTEQEHLSYKTLQQNKATRITTTAAGKTIQLTDASNDSLVNLIAHGDSWQNQYEGYQLFDFENTDFTDKNYCTITDSELYSDSIAYISIWIPYKRIPFEHDGQVTVSAKMKCGTATRISIGVVYEDGSLGFDANRQTTSEYFTTSFTSDISKKVVGIGFSYESNGSFWVKDIMINEGTEVKPYEPYFGGQPSPSPQYPQDIENLDKVEVKVLGKNICNDILESTYAQSEGADSSTIRTFVPNTYRKGFVSDGTHNEDTINVNFLSDRVEVKYHYFGYGLGFPMQLPKGETVTASLVCATSENFSFYWAFYDNDGKVIGQEHGKQTVLIPNDCEWTVVIVSGNPNDGWVSFVGLQVEHGTQSTPFEPYTEQTLTIPYVLRKGDKVEYANRKKRRVRKRRIFDGTERWYSAFGSCYETDPSSDDLKFLMETAQIPKDVLCNCFGYEKTPEPPSENHFRITVDNGTAYILFKPSADSIPSGNVDAWKTYLAEQYANGTPVYIEYESTEPIETDLTEADIQAFMQIHTNYPTTTIISNAELEVEYVADTKLYIDNKFKELEANVTSAIAQLL